MNSGMITPEIIMLGGAISCFLAVLTLFFAGKFSFVQGLGSRLAAIETQISERKKILSDVGKKIAEAEELKQKVDHGEKRLVALQQELKPLEEKHLKALSDYEDSKGKLRGVRDDWNQMREKVELYKDRVANLDNLEQEIKQLSDKHKELSLLVEGLPEKQKEYEDLKNLVEIAKQEFNDLTSEIGSLKDSVDVASKRLQDLLDQETELHKSIEAKKNQLDQMNAQTAILNIELAAKREKAGYTSRLTAESFNSLYEPVFTHQERQEDVGEVVLLDGLGSHIENMGFDFSQRLQWAFHTALKTSDISCLTVMAGVSGTGKSALPRLYAEAMGMHFLPIAVEPRWDSPNDLFGFFNYMENRFESTPLARSLVQFGRREGDRGGELNDQMLVVLLDEMNLARVEYYFSEFLSRLELRRDVNLNSLEDFQKVSVEIFPGIEEKDNRADPIRLFAGNNILFVGTMNEDESTQSLSDKVIDRANVLHFGRPLKLHNKETILNIQQLNSGVLAADTFKSWQKDSTPEVIESYSDLSKKLSDLNEVLGNLGRPFAHRTFQAILKYVANYPGIDKGYQRPLADQIAMRIMPKLRGLDLADNGQAFNQLDSIIRAVKDEGLNTAYDVARKSRQGVFHWQGISWKD